MVVDCPAELIATAGRLLPAGPILQLLMVILSLPVVPEEAPNKTVAATGEEAVPSCAGVAVEEPRSVQLVTVLL